MNATYPPAAIRLQDKQQNIFVHKDLARVPRWWMILGDSPAWIKMQRLSPMEATCVTALELNWNLAGCFMLEFCIRLYAGNRHIRDIPTSGNSIYKKSSKTNAYIYI